MRTKLHGYLWLTLAFLSCNGDFAASKNVVERPNILNMTQGTILIKVPEQYSENAWAAFNAVDGDVNRGWSSAEHKAIGQFFLFELPQAYRMDTVTVDNTFAQETSYPGISAKGIELWGSTTSDKDGFKKLATIQAPSHTRTTIPLPAGCDARWVKLVIASNWGHKDYTEVMDLEINGTPIGTAPPVKSFSGVFDSNYGPIRFAQNGNSVSGCYYDGSGTLHGATEGRTLRFDWYQTGNNHGTAMMVLNGDGTLLNGVWYKNGVPQGPWLGHRTDGACNCEVSVSGNGIARRLVDSQRAILYGIHFDTDSATIKPESAATLNELLSVLGDKAGLRIEVEGHTDSTNTAAYNQSLSQRRAQAVVDWLKQHSIAAARITAKGYGADKPVADNTTMQGRALNRRVEISALK